MTDKLEQEIIKIQNLERKIETTISRKDIAKRKELEMKLANQLIQLYEALEKQMKILSVRKTVKDSEVTR